jgi:hypothetical protein
VALGIVFLLAATAVLSVRTLFRWRTWRDRGLVGLLVVAALGVVFCTRGGEAVHGLFSTFLESPGGAVILPALSLLLGFSGVDPFPFALLFGVISPHTPLSLSVTLPLLLGGLPAMILQICMMPPRAERRERGDDVPFAGKRPQ